MKKGKKEFTILGFSIYRLLAYFIIYSVVGYFIETAFGAVTKGLLESRKSFLYGPFCAIYGVGSVVMIVFLQYFKKNRYTLFLGGFLIGSIVEYSVSLIGELILHVKWWDYSAEPFNINGRICVLFSIYWGFLAIYLMAHFNPKIDKLINKIKDKFSEKLLKSVTIIVTIVMFIDCIVTMLALNIFFGRLISDYNLEVENAEKYVNAYSKVCKNDTLKNFTDKFFSNEQMIRTFPNLKITSNNGSIIYVDYVLKDIQPYYIKLFTPKENIRYKLFN